MSLLLLLLFFVRVCVLELVFLVYVKDRFTNMHQMPSNTNLSWEIYQNYIIASDPPCSKYTANKPIRSVGASFFNKYIRLP